MGPGNEECSKGTDTGFAPVPAEVQMGLRGQVEGHTEGQQKFLFFQVSYPEGQIGTGVPHIDEL